MGHLVRYHHVTVEHKVAFGWRDEDAVYRGCGESCNSTNRDRDIIHWGAPPPKIFTLNMASAVSKLTLENLQHPTRFNPEIRNYILNASSNILFQNCYTA
jgi:hypothetical protein